MASWPLKAEQQWGLYERLSQPDTTQKSQKTSPTKATHGFKALPMIKETDESFQMPQPLQSPLMSPWVHPYQGARNETKQLEQAKSHGRTQKVPNASRVGSDSKALESRSILCNSQLQKPAVTTTAIKHKKPPLRSVSLQPWGTWGNTATSASQSFPVPHLGTNFLPGLGASYSLPKARSMENLSRSMEEPIAPHSPSATVGSPNQALTHHQFSPGRGLLSSFNRLTLQSGHQAPQPENRGMYELDSQLSSIAHQLEPSRTLGPCAPGPVVSYVSPPIPGPMQTRPSMQFNNAPLPFERPPQGVPQWLINPNMGLWFVSNYPPEYATQKNPYKNLTISGLPKLQKLLGDFMPFGDNCLNKRDTHTHACVLKLTNVPFDVEKCEIIAALGRNAHVISYPENSINYGVHIIYDRHLGKTGDVYVECPTQQEARNIWNSLDRYLVRTGKGRVVRNRVINFEIVNPGELCAMLFPKAKCTGWKGFDPVIHVPRESYEAPFDGFLTDEELRSLVQHTRRPGQGQHGKESPQRPFENMISILQKYPWHCTDLYTIEERDCIFVHLCKMVEELTRQVKDCKDGRGIFGQRNFSTKITQQLLQELVTTACTFGNFTLKQQHLLICITAATNSGSRIDTTVRYPLYRVSPFYAFHALATLRGADELLLEYYTRLIYIATTSSHASPIQEIITTARVHPDLFEHPFGGLGSNFVGDRRHQRMFDVSMFELNVINHLVARLIVKAESSPALRALIPDWETVRYPYAGPYI